jgi:hypothetical protein
VGAVVSCNSATEGSVSVEHVQLTVRMAAETTAEDSGLSRLSECCSELHSVGINCSAIVVCGSINPFSSPNSVNTSSKHVSMYQSLPRRP